MFKLLIATAFLMSVSLTGTAFATSAPANSLSKAVNSSMTVEKKKKKKKKPSKNNSIFSEEVIE